MSGRLKMILAFKLLQVKKKINEVQFPIRLF